MVFTENLSACYAIKIGWFLYAVRPLVNYSDMPETHILALSAEGALRKHYKRQAQKQRAKFDQSDLVW